MRVILFILFLFSSSAFGNIAQTIPTGPQLSQIDQLFCARRANVGASAHQFAVSGGSLKEQLKEWDNFVSKMPSKNVEIAELVLLRHVISFAWELHKDHPEVTSLDYGDYIYSHCVKQKTRAIVKFF